MVKIINNSDAFLDSVKKNAKAILAEVAEKVSVSAKKIVPVKTGALRESIEVNQEDLTAHIGSDLHYAGYIEAGTSKMSAQPYLRPALMGNLHKIKRAFEAV